MTKYRVVFESRPITNCWDCPMCVVHEYDDADQCKALGRWFTRQKTIPSFCPLEEMK
jgi:hypothetical protein